MISSNFLENVPFRVNAELEMAQDQRQNTLKRFNEGRRLAMKASDDKLEMTNRQHPEAYRRLDDEHRLAMQKAEHGKTRLLAVAPPMAACTTIIRTLSKSWDCLRAARSGVKLCIRT